MTLATTLVEITDSERNALKFEFKPLGSTLSTSPPVIPASLLRESMLHSSPLIERIFTVTPLFFAN